MHACMYACLHHCLGPLRPWYVCIHACMHAYMRACMSVRIGLQHLGNQLLPHELGSGVEPVELVLHLC